MNDEELRNHFNNENLPEITLEWVDANCDVPDCPPCNQRKKMSESADDYAIVAAETQDAVVAGKHEEVVCLWNRKGEAIGFIPLDMLLYVASEASFKRRLRDKIEQKSMYDLFQFKKDDDDS